MWWMDCWRDGDVQIKWHGRLAHAQAAIAANDGDNAIRSLAVAILFTFAAAAQAASPALNLVTPRGGQRGTEIEITLAGERIADAQELLIYQPGITVTKLEAKDAKKVTAMIAIAADAVPGEYPLRLRTATGISELRTFYVGTLPSVAEKEPNNEYAKPQKIELNHTVHGVIENEDVDYFIVEAIKGQRLTVEVEGMRLGNALFDPYIAVLDANGAPLAAVDDSALLLQDPVASIVVPEDGQYIIQLRDSAYGGGGSWHYRMHVGTFPRPAVVYPPGGPAGEEVSLKFIGDALGAIDQSIKLPAEPEAEHRLFLERDGQIPPSANWFRVSAFPNVLEIEPNNNVKTATPSSELPVAFNGIMSQAGDVDFFKFTAKKDQPLDIHVRARALRSPLDPVLVVHDAAGKGLANNDDTAGPDSYLRFTPPEDGEYAVSVRDHLRGGGEEYVYRIEVMPVSPQLTLSIPLVQPNSQERQTITVPRGNRVATLMRAAKNDFSSALTIVATNLPPGVMMHADPMAENIDTLPIVFEAAADAPVGGHLVAIGARPAKEDLSIATHFQQTTDLVVGPNQTPLYQVRTDKLAIAVAEEAPFKLSIVQPKVPLVRGGSMQLKVVAERKEGFKAPIELAMVFNPPGVGSGGVNIAEGATEAVIPLNASRDAQTRKWKIAVLGSADANGKVWVSSQLADLEVAAPMLDMKMDMVAVEQGNSGQVIFQIEQKTPFEGKAQVKLLGLPPNASAEEKEITSEDATVVFDVKADAKTPTGQHATLFCSVTVMKEGEPIVHSVGNGGVLRIDAPAPAAPEKAQAAAPPPPAEAPTKPLSRLEKLRQEQAQRAQQQQQDQPPPQVSTQP